MWRMMTRNVRDLWNLPRFRIGCSHRIVGLSTTCDSQDLTLHMMLSEGVATVRQNPLQGL